jgi:hypothetical protein
MPSKSASQHGFMGASSTPQGRKKLRAHGKTPAPVKVAREFLKADKGRSFKKEER